MKRFSFNNEDKDKEYWYIDDRKTNKTYYIDNLEELCDVLNHIDEWRTDCIANKNIIKDKLMAHQDVCRKHKIYSVDELDEILEKYYKGV